MRNDLVRKGYNKAAHDYLKSRDLFKNNKYLAKFNRLIKPKSLILDIGCGAGKPIDEFFVRHGHKIIGIDISKKQIELAKKILPTENFQVKDILNLRKGEFQVDAVVSFYTIFHTSRERHQEIFEKIYSFLPNDGKILVTMGSENWEGIENNFHGAKMFWSHYDSAKNKEIIKKAGFEILFDEIDQSGGEKHLVVIARKIK